MPRPLAAENPKGAGRKCGICLSAERDAIDRKIVEGVPLEAIARDYAVTPDAVSRHKARHMPRAALQSAAEAAVEAEGARGADLLSSATALRLQALSLMRQAEEASDLRTALLGVREATRCLELEAKLRGELDQNATINLNFGPQFILLQQNIVRALSAYPEALRAVETALLQIEGAAP